MFTGIGGFELGIQRATLSVRDRKTSDTKSEAPQPGLESTTKGILSDGNITHDLSNGESGEILCVGYSEIDKYAIQTFEHHFGKEVKNYGDATKLNTSELPDFDLLVGGFPCQAFSLAGKRAGFEDTRGTLIFDVVRVLRDKRPRHFILENVKGLLSHEGGKTFAAILEILTDTGYDVSWSIHNSKNYGVPQNRERVYLIGNLRGEPRPQVFPLRASNQEAVVSNTVRTGGQGSLSKKHAWDFIRRLTPVECERLQGFPDGWTLGSDSQRYKQCGNAITVNVVEHVVRSLYAKTNND